MKKLVIKSFALVAVFLFCQANPSLSQKKDAVKAVLSADSLASGNIKDILISFFQLSFNNLTGKNKELNFNSNPYALMLKNNPDLALDTYYWKYRFLRKLNFGVNLKLDTSYKFNGFSFGVKYAIINNRDTTTSLYLAQSLKNDELNKELLELRDSLAAIRDTAAARGDRTRARMINAGINQLAGTTSVAFNKMSTDFQKIVDSLVVLNSNLDSIKTLIGKDRGVSFRKVLDDAFSKNKSDLQKRGLWTVSISDTTYKDKFALSNLVLASQYSKGVFKRKPGSNFEIDVKGALNFLDDTTQNGNDLKRCVLNSEAGLNWVIRNRNNDHSWLELKFSGSYQHNFNRLYNKEERDQLMFNGTLRLRIIADIWVPLEFKYDPKSGNVFGFLNVRANFSTLGNIVKDK